MTSGGQERSDGEHCRPPGKDGGEENREPGYDRDGA